MGHSGHFLFLSFQHLTVNLIMTTFEQLTSGIRRNCSANWATTTALTWSYLYIEKKFVKLPNFKIEKVEWDKNWHMGKTSRTCSKAATNVKIEILLESFRLKNVLKSSNGQLSHARHCDELRIRLHRADDASSVTRIGEILPNLGKFKCLA